MSIDSFTANTEKVLYETFKGVLDTALPVREKHKPTFLEISGFPHYEEVISNWYSFFFDPAAEHNLSTLFISSLLDCMAEKNDKVRSNLLKENAKVAREKVIAGGRIDLLIYDDFTGKAGEERYSNAIIIENKVYAAVYNDLDLYFNAIGADNKVGVLLTIEPVKLDDSSRFINITHRKLINQVTGNLGYYLVKADPRSLLLLKELVQEITRFTKSINMKEYVHFYFDNAKKINELIQIKGEVLSSMMDSIRSRLEGTSFNWIRKYPDYFNLKYNRNPEILVSLSVDSLFIQEKVSIKMWFSGKLAKAWDWQKNSVQLNSIGKHSDIVLNEAPTGTQWALVATEDVSFGLSKENIDHLPERIAEHLESHWKPLIEKLMHIHEP